MKASFLNIYEVHSISVQGGSWDYNLGTPTDKIQGQPTPKLVKRILTFSNESSDWSESSSKMGDTNEQLSAIMAQLQMMNLRLAIQDKEIKALREKLIEEEV